MKAISSRLSKLVSSCVSILGQEIKEVYGENTFNTIEKIRKLCVKSRDSNSSEKSNLLEKINSIITNQSKEERERIAQSFSLMLELMNTCENAYRSWRSQETHLEASEKIPDHIIYVLTAHPTECRHIYNIRIFKKILSILEKGNENLSSPQVISLRKLLNKSLSTPLVRTIKPKVLDEAELVYESLCEEKTLDSLLSRSQKKPPVFIRSWVGGDKDGHPGVNQIVFLQSLQKSRKNILNYLLKKVKILHSKKCDLSKFIDLLSSNNSLQSFWPNEGESISKLKTSLHQALKDHPDKITAHRVKGLFYLFPALVVPLEFREDSGVLKDNPHLLEGMLKALSEISQNSNPLYYVRALIISMTTEAMDLQRAKKLVIKNLGSYAIPVVPLFERNQDLLKAPEIMDSLFKTSYKKDLKKFNNTQEIMLGYSDSAKEGGVFASRLQIQESMKALEETLESHQIKPIFFHGSGGSSDRGGGPIEDQIQSWTKSALCRLKVTIQGESIDRTLASAQLTDHHLQKISAVVGKKIELFKPAPANSKTLKKFKETSSKNYKNFIASELFLKTIEKATPYPFLSELKFGSRPSKRSKTVSVKGLRAIPWILCWTQTRLMFPIWFGVGSAWKELSSKEKKALEKEVLKNPAFKSYIRTLHYTIKKIEPEVWLSYLMASSLTDKEKNEVRKKLEEELKSLNKMLKTLNHKDLLIKPWLEESISLRSPLIAPLNLIQIMALEEKDLSLLRLSVAGVALGMQSTG